MPRPYKPHLIVQNHMKGEFHMVPYIQAHPKVRDCQEVEVLYALRRANRGELDSGEALDMAEAIDLTASKDPGLVILILTAWIELSSRAKRFTEVEALLHRAQSFLTPHMPPELHDTVLHAESSLRLHQGDLLSRLALHKKSLALLPKTSGLRHQRLSSHGVFLGILGLGAQAKRRLGELEGVKSKEAQAPWVDFCHFVVHTTCGQFEKALSYCPSVEADEIHAQGLHWRGVIFAAYKSLIQLVLAHRTSAPESTEELKRILQAALAPLASLKDAAFVATFSKNLEALGLLLAKRPKQALAVCQDIMKSKSDHFVTSHDLLSYNLIRAELACGHADAAERVLHMRQAAGNAQYHDHLYEARIAWLRGETQTARQALAQYEEEIKRQGGQGRYAFEVDMAWEWTPFDFITLKSGKVAVRAVSKPMAVAQDHNDELLGKHAAILSAKKTLSEFARVELPVLISGETGTGKELAARALHAQSPRASEPFVAINCSAVTEGLLESELFGHVQGAFTGASKAHKGVFEQAGKGTLFLDEIGDITPKLQAALLRVLQENEIRPVGGEKVKKVFARVVTATHAPLLDMVEKGTFRKDLYYRISGLTVALPALRDRGEDVVHLAEQFLSEGRPKGSIILTPKLKEVLKRYPWPGNVRELKNEMERMRLLHSDKSVYELDDLDQRLQADPDAPGEPSGKSHIPIFRRLDVVKELFLEHKKLSRVEISLRLGVSKKTVTKDLKQLAEEGFIEKVMPTPSPKTHYFLLKA